MHVDVHRLFDSINNSESTSKESLGRLRERVALRLLLQGLGLPLRSLSALHLLLLDAVLLLHDLLLRLCCLQVHLVLELRVHVALLQTMDLVQVRSLHAVVLGNFRTRARACSYGGHLGSCFRDMAAARAAR